MEKEELEMINKTFATKEDLESILTQKNTDQDLKQQIMGFVDHLNQCGNDDCEIHKTKDDIETQSFILGYLARDQIE